MMTKKEYNKQYYQNNKTKRKLESQIYYWANRQKVLAKKAMKDAQKSDTIRTAEDVFGAEPDNNN
jgi:hypothetical protein